MGKVLVVYATRTSETERIANLVAEGVRMAGSEAMVKNVKDIKTYFEFNLSQLSKMISFFN